MNRPVDFSKVRMNVQYPRVLEQRERRKGTESYLIQKSRPLTMEAAAVAAI